jgi:hypothetical protein
MAYAWPAGVYPADFNVVAGIVEMEWTDIGERLLVTCLRSRDFVGAGLSLAQTCSAWHKIFTFKALPRVRGELNSVWQLFLRAYEAEWQPFLSACKRRTTFVEWNDMRPLLRSLFRERLQVLEPWPLFAVVTFVRTRFPALTSSINSFEDISKYLAVPLISNAITESRSWHSLSCPSDFAKHLMGPILACAPDEEKAPLLIWALWISRNIGALYSHSVYGRALRAFLVAETGMGDSETRDAEY